MPFDRSDRKVVRACLALRFSDRTDADAQRARPLKVRIVGLGDGIVIVFHECYFGTSPLEL
jgi:hypothetical protein